jgi:Sigma-70 region 2
MSRHCKDRHLTDEQLRQANQLCERHLVLAKKFARLKRLQGVRLGWSVEELESIAYEGLIVASRTFDPARGRKFETWAFLKMLDALKLNRKKLFSDIRGRGKERIGLPYLGDDDFCPVEPMDERPLRFAPLEVRELVEKVISGIEPRDRECVRSFFWKGQSATEIWPGTELQAQYRRRRLLKQCAAALSRFQWDAETNENVMERFLSLLNADASPPQSKPAAV